MVEETLIIEAAGGEKRECADERRQASRRRRYAIVEMATCGRDAQRVISGVLAAY